MNITPTVGDLLMREKALGVFNHVGVFVAPNTVLQNTPERGEHLATVEQFSAGRRVKVQPTGANPLSVSARVRRILARARAYNPFSRNCEHTATEATHGSAWSPQLRVALVCVCLGILAFLFLRRR